MKSIEDDLLKWIESKVQNRTFKTKSEAVELSISIIQYFSDTILRDIMVQNDCKARQVFLFLDKEIANQINEKIENGGFNSKEEFVLNLIKENLQIT